MAYKIIGLLYMVEPIQQVSQNYQKRNVVLFIENMQNPQYSDYISFEVTGKNLGVPDTIALGTMVEVTFAMQGRKYTKKDGSGDGFINTAKLFNIAPYVAQTAQPMAAPQAAQTQPTQPQGTPIAAYQQYQQPQPTQLQPTQPQGYNPQATYQQYQQNPPMGAEKMPF